jgi:hypothetical protein
MLKYGRLKSKIMKTRVFCLAIAAVAVVVLMLAAAPASACAARGQIVIISPTGNTGANPGAGLISPRNTAGALTGPPYHVFQIPSDVVAGQVLWEGLDVTYTLSKCNQATAVQRDVV